ncbi:MAG: hypothetical protein WA705_22400 [Candidatus Ozemobacteraceae bacterium]
MKQHLIQKLETLLTQGETILESETFFPVGLEKGLWAYSADKKRAVATPVLMKLWSTLPDTRETVLAMLAIDPRYRIPWLEKITARLQLAGKHRQMAELIDRIDTLGPVCKSALPLIEKADLSPTAFQDLERDIIGFTADMAQAQPPLLRAIKAGSPLVELNQGKPFPPLPNIAPLDINATWKPGRLIALPDDSAEPPQETTSILSGALAPLKGTEQADLRAPLTETLGWVLSRPWAFLLAQIVFTQETWLAERLSGGLTLELEEAQLSRYDHPLTVGVVVCDHQGNEQLCGSLGQLTQRILDTLGITILTPPRELKTLDERLGGVIHELLLRKIWRFDDRRMSGRQCRYQIHDTFSRECYRIFGGKYFARPGAVVSRAVRRACMTWLDERLPVRRAKQA